MTTSIPYNPRTRGRLTPIEAIDGQATLTCHTNHRCFAGVTDPDLLVPLLGYALVGEEVA
jgi:hypothetical protein